MSPPRPSPPGSLRHVLYLRRIHELMRDGYLAMVRQDDVARLTDKGMVVLMACADRPLPRPLPRPKPRRQGEVS